MGEITPIPWPLPTSSRTFRGDELLNKKHNVPHGLELPSSAVGIDRDLDPETVLEFEEQA